MVWLYDDAYLLRFFNYVNSIHPQIRFRMEYGRSVHYMDSELTIEANGQISSDLYVKPTDKHQYILPPSNHLPHLPYGIFIQLSQIISVDERFIRRYLAPNFTTSMYIRTNDQASRPISLSAVHSCVFSHLLCLFHCSSHPPS